MGIRIPEFERLPDVTDKESLDLQSTFASLDPNDACIRLEHIEMRTRSKGQSDDEGPLIDKKDLSSFEDSEDVDLKNEDARSAVTVVSLQDGGTAKWARLKEPFSWLAMLSRELNGSFVFGVMVVYGATQGLGGALEKVVVNYYWKDVQGAQPSALPFYKGIFLIPWDVKPLWGFLTDAVPLAGYHRRPYFIISGLLSLGAYMTLVVGNLYTNVAVVMLLVASISTALTDATIDAEVARKSREKPNLGADIQSLCAYSSAVGGLLGYACGGKTVHAVGAQGALGLYAIPSILLFVLGFILYEPCLPKHLWYSLQLKRQAYYVTTNVWTTLQHPSVWKPTLYMYLSLALSPDISSGKFFWYSDSVVGPGFSEEFVGGIFAMGSVGTLIAVVIYQRTLKTVSFRSLLTWIQLLVAATGILDLILITRLNRKLHIPDYIFAVGDESLTQAIGRLKWIPLLVLAAKLCPPGIEGTFFAFLMSVDNVGMFTSAWAGSLVLQFTKVSRTDFRFLWVAVLVRSLLRLLPIAFVFLLPSTGTEEQLLPTELTGPVDVSKASEEQEENLQLVV